MTRQAIESVVVVGGGQIALLAATAIARTSPATRVTVLRVPLDPAALADIAHVAPPSLARLHRRLGIDEPTVLARAGASHWLATRYDGWADREFMIGFGAAPDIGTFELAWQGHNGADHVGASTIAQALARQNRFAPPSDDAHSPLSDLDYGLRFVPEAHCGLLSGLARHLGIAMVDAPLAGVRRDAGGMVRSAVLADDSHIDADLFIDASGPAAVLRLDDSGFVDWSQRLFADRLLYAQAAQPGLSTLDQAVRVDGGYLLHSPGRDSTRSLIAYRSDAMSDQQASDTLRGLDLVPTTRVAIAAGRVARPWHGNVIAIGDAAARFEPLGAVNLHLAVRQIGLLTELLPSSPSVEEERGEYNRRAALLADGACDFVAALHASRPSHGSTRDLSDTLARTLDLAARRGIVARWGEDCLSRDLWAQLLQGMGVMRQADAVTQAMPAPHRAALAARRAERIARTVAQAQPYPIWLGAALQSASARRT